MRPRISIRGLSPIRPSVYTSVDYHQGKTVGRIYFPSIYPLGLALWSRTTKNRGVSTGPLARPFAFLLALLTHLLAPHCLLPLRALLRSFVCLLAHSLLSSWESVKFDVSKWPGFVPQWLAWPFASHLSIASFIWISFLLAVFVHLVFFILCFLFFLPGFDVFFSHLSLSLRLFFSSFSVHNLPWHLGKKKDRDTWKISEKKVREPFSFDETLASSIENAG